MTIFTTFEDQKNKSVMLQMGMEKKNYYISNKEKIETINNCNSNFVFLSASKIR